MGDLTPGALRAWLVQQDRTLDKDTLDILEGQKIEMQSFVLLDRDDLLAINIPLGPVKKLLKIIKELEIPTGDFIVAENGNLVACPVDMDFEDLLQDPLADFEDDHQMFENEEDVPAVPVTGRVGGGLQEQINTEFVINNKRKRNVEDDLKQLNEYSMYACKKPKLKRGAPCTSTTVSGQVSKIEDPPPKVYKITRYGSLEETLKARFQGGAKLAKSLKEHPIEKDRRLLVRILVDELTECDGKNCYPVAEAKIALAQTIVEEFPLLKHPTLPGFQHFFDPNTRRTGHIETRLWTLRKELLEDERKYKPKSKNKVDESHQIGHGLLLPADLEKKKSLMKYTIPNEKNMNSTRLIMKETFGDRRTWILTKAPSVGEIVEDYPRLFDYSGQMIDDDFDRIHPGCDKRYKEEFPTYWVPRIIAYAKAFYKNFMDEVNSQYSHEDNSFKALCVLQKLLPSYNRKKRRTIVTNSQNSDVSTLQNNQRAPLIEVVPENKSIQATMNELRKGRKNTLQPYLIRAESKHSRYFIDADGLLFKREGKPDIVSSFDLLFKSYQILNVQYPTELDNFYSFVGCHIYGIQGVENSSVASLFVSLSNFNSEAFKVDTCNS